MNFIRNTLVQGAFWQLNKALVKAFKIEAAVLLTEMIDLYFYLENKNLLIEKDGELWFYFTSEQIEEKTTLTYRQQKTCLTNLTSVVETRLFGVPAKLYYRIDFAKLSRIIEVEMCKTSIAESAILDLAKAQNLNVQNRKTIYKEHNKENKEIEPNKEEENAPFFSPPISNNSIELPSLPVELGQPETYPAPPTQPNPTFSIESLKSSLLSKCGLPNTLPEYLGKLGITPTHEKGKPIFNEIFELWFSKQMADKANLPITQGDEEKCVQLMHKQYEKKVSIKQELLYFFSYKKDVAKKLMETENVQKQGRKQEYLPGNNIALNKIKPKWIKRPFTQEWVEVWYYCQDNYPHLKKHSQIEVIQNADREYLMRFCKEYIDMPEIIAPQA